MSTAMADAANWNREHLPLCRFEPKWYKLATYDLFEIAYKCTKLCEAKLYQDHQSVVGINFFFLKLALAIKILQAPIKLCVKFSPIFI